MKTGILNNKNIKVDKDKQVSINPESNLIQPRALGFHLIPNSLQKSFDITV